MPCACGRRLSGCAGARTPCSAAAPDRSGPDRHSRPRPAHQPDHGDAGRRHAPVLVRRLGVVRAAQTGAVEGTSALFWPSKAALGRKDLPGPFSPAAVAREVRVPIEHALYLTVDAHAARGLTDRLDQIYDTNFASGSITRPTTWCSSPIPSRTGSSTTRTKWSQDGSSSCSAGSKGRAFSPSGGWAPARRRERDGSCGDGPRRRQLLPPPSTSSDDGLT